MILTLLQEIVFVTDSFGTLPRSSSDALAIFSEAIPKNLAAGVMILAVLPF